MTTSKRSISITRRPGEKKPTIVVTARPGEVEAAHAWLDETKRTASTARAAIRAMGFVVGVGDADAQRERADFLAGWLTAREG